MRIYSLFISVLIVIASCSNTEESARLEKNINREWQFTFSSEEDDFSLETTVGAEWERVGIPHSFSLPYFRSESFYEGYGWYQKSIFIKEDWLNRNISLEFDGVFQVAEIFLNGKKVEEHRGGYTGFSVDISDVVKAGKNILAVRVNNLWDAQLAPRAGEHVFSGGIYRDVYLSITDPLHIVWNGTFITTPEVSREKALVNVKTEVKNSNDVSHNFTLKTVILNSTGKQIAEMISKQSVEANKLLLCEQSSREISDPNLWSHEDPYLYRVYTYIYQNDSLVDNYQTTFGFRWMEWTSDKGFFLNGEHLYLEGVNVHQDHAGWGDAVTKAGIYRDLKLMKDAGFNLIRGSHYPHHPYFTEVCDELGLLFIPENCVWGIGGFGEDGNWKSSTYPVYEEDQKGYEASAAKSLEELIRINRNSPSVIAWSMSNEAFFTNNDVVKEMKKMLVNLVDLSHQLDPSRMAMIGGAQRKDVDILGDIAGYNGDGAVRDLDPGIPNMVSEYGSCVSDRPGEYIPCWGQITEGEKPEWRSGHAIWCGFDHGSIAGNMGEMGIVDYARIPKRSWYWYRNYFKGIEPPEWPLEGTPKSLRLFADKTTIQGTDATDDVHINVQLIGTTGKHISNSPDVTLTILSGPGEFPTGRSITFSESTRNDIQILDGHAAIEFRSYEGGESVIEATSEGLEPAQIVITTLGEPIFEVGKTLPVTDRPYTDYRLLKAIEEGKPAKVSDSRPTLTDSKSNSLPSLANDGHKWTKWISDLENGSVWWELDMENFYDVERVELTIQSTSDLSIFVETSCDQMAWNEVARGFYNSGSIAPVSFYVKDDSEVRFFRVSFIAETKARVSIGEIEVYGTTE